MERARIIVYIASSMDGYIADNDGGVGWLDPFTGVDTGYDEFISSVGVIAMGRATFDHAQHLGPIPKAKGPTFVLTSRTMPGDTPPEIQPLGGAIPEIATRLRDAAAESGGGNIWLMGGGKVLAAFLDHGEVDGFELFIIPVLLGSGIPLFPARDGSPMAAFTLEASKAYSNGIAGLSYKVT